MDKALKFKYKRIVSHNKLGMNHFVSLWIHLSPIIEGGGEVGLEEEGEGEGEDDGDEHQAGHDWDQLHPLL